MRLNSLSYTKRFTFRKKKIICRGIQFFLSFFLSIFLICLTVVGTGQTLLWKVGRVGGDVVRIIQRRFPFWWRADKVVKPRLVKASSYPLYNALFWIFSILKSCAALRREDQAEQDEGLADGSEFEFRCTHSQGFEGPNEEIRQQDILYAAFTGVEFPWPAKAKVTADEGQRPSRKTTNFRLRIQFVLMTNARATNVV